MHSCSSKYFNDLNVPHLSLKYLRQFGLLFTILVADYGKLSQRWNGGQVPVLGNPLYLSIVDELREQESAIDETWETVLPTNLIALQKSGVAVDVTGLPCGEGCEVVSNKDNLIDNPHKLNVKTTNP